MTSSSRLSFSRPISSSSSSSHFLLLLLLCFFTFFSYSLPDVCTNIDCGQGHCVPALGGLLPSCECNPGWKTIIISPMPIGACIVPNCTLDLTCGSGTHAPPPAPINFTDPCNFVWCWNGNCVANGTGHYCQCTDGASNLFNNPAFVCINQCNLGGDCHNLGLGQSPPPPSTSSGSPPPSGGRNEAPYSLKKVPIVVLAVLTSTLFTGI